MAETQKCRLDITSAVLNQVDHSWIFEARHLADAAGVELGMQVHNSASDEVLAMAENTGLPLSFHSPVQGGYMFNFAAENADLSWQMIEEQYSLMQKYHVTRTVFHGFLMTDTAIESFGHGKTYGECMLAGFRRELVRAPGSRFVRDFTGSDEFIMRRERVKNNLRRLRELHPDCLWCVENDFPAYTSGMLRGEDLAYIDHETCFDTGHMWAACKMLDRDFYCELDNALSGGKVRMVHLHASRYTMDMPNEEFGDGHLPLTTPTEIDLGLVVRKCRNAGTRHFVLEIGNAALEDIKIFLSYYNED